MGNLILILTSVFLGSIGQIVLKLGSNKLTGFMASPSNIIKSVFSILLIPEIVIGLVLFGTSFLLWIKVLTSNELSYAYPMVSLGYILTTFAGVFLFKETFTTSKLIGVIVIIVGVYIINK